MKRRRDKCRITCRITAGLPHAYTYLSNVLSRYSSATAKYPPRGVRRYRTQSDGRAPSLPRPFLDLDFAGCALHLSACRPTLLSVLFRFNLYLTPPSPPTRRCERADDRIKQANRFNIRRYTDWHEIFPRVQGLSTRYLFGYIYKAYNNIVTDISIASPER